MKKIVYVNPPFGNDFVRSARWAAKSRGRVQRHPEQALIHIAILEEDGHICKFIEGAARNMTELEIVKEIAAFEPDIAIIHSTTPSIYNDIQYARRAKEACGCLTVMVGAHASAETENTFANSFGAIDVIVRGEPDYALRDIAHCIPLKLIEGISYYSDGRIVHNPDRAYLDVNKLPFPSWSHVDPRWYHDAGKLYPFLTLYTGRGCFGLCTFCRETQTINGRKLRIRDTAKVVDEMENDIRQFPYLREIMFETDTFTASPSHVKGVCEEIIRRGLHKRISWSCNVRVDIMLDLLPLMKKAGCRMLMIGFEFGTDKQLKAVKKGTTVEMARKFADTAARLGFTLHGCFMIGAPGETPETARETIEFAKNLPLDTIQISGVAAYPGTEFYEWAKSHGFITAKDWVEWVDDNHEQITILSYPQMSKAEIDYYIDKGLKEFYLRPNQIIKMLLAIRSYDDIKRKVYGLMSFLDYFKVNRRTKEI